MTLRNLFLFATLILAFSCQAQNLLENPDFIPSVRESYSIHTREALVIIL